MLGCSAAVGSGLGALQVVEITPATPPLLPHPGWAYAFQAFLCAFWGLVDFCNFSRLLPGTGCAVLSPFMWLWAKHTYTYTHIYTNIYLRIYIHKFIGLWFICRRSANEFWLPLSLAGTRDAWAWAWGVGAGLHTHHRRRRLALDGGLICALLSPRLPLCCLITT